MNPLSRQGRYGQTGYCGADQEVFKRLKSVIEAASIRSIAHRAGRDPAQ
jgi:hypothetical protein